MNKQHNQADVRAWLEKANDDLRFAEANLPGPFYAQVCFVSQQVAEKALKAYAYSLQEDFTPQEIKILHTHKLENIIDFIMKRGGSIPDSISILCVDLDNFYVSARYPDVPAPVGTYTEDVARSAFTKATQVVELVGKILEGKQEKK